MNEITKKKIAIGFLGVAIVIGMGFSIYVSKNFNNDESKDNENDKEIISEVDKEKPKKDKEDIIVNPLDGTEPPELSKDKGELSPNEIRMTVSQVRDYFREYKFEKGVEILNDLSDKNKFTGEAEILKAYHYDGNIMTNLIPFHTPSHDGLTVGEGIVSGQALLNLMTGFQDPENLLIATIYLDSNIRGKVIDYGGSLNPIYDEGLFPNILGSTVEEVPQDILIMYPDTEKYHKIQFTLDGNSLNGYILESKEGKLKFYSIESPNNSTHYYTVDQWKRMEDNKKKGRPIMEGVLDMYPYNEKTPVSEETETETETETDEESKNK